MNHKKMAEIANLIQVRQYIVNSIHYSQNKTREVKRKLVQSSNVLEKEIEASLFAALGIKDESIDNP